jgi:O-antigen/teichoic acid export membrane protein
LKFKALTLRTFVASIISGTLGVICAYQGWGVYSLVVQTLSFGLFSTLLLWSTSSWKPSWHFSMEEVKRLMGFSIYAFLERILNNIFIRLDVLLLGRIFSPVTVGFYSRASTLVDQVTKYSSTSIIRVLFPVLSKVQDNQEEYEKIYFRMFSIISFLSYALSGLLYFIGPDIILLLFGNKWQASVQIFQILIIASCNIPLNSLMWNALMSKGKAKENFYYGILRKSVGLIPFIFAFYFNIWWFTVTWVVSKFIISILNIMVLKKYSNLSVSRHFYYLTNGLIVLLPGFLIFEYLELNQFATRIIFAISYLLIYLFVNWLIKNEGLIYILSTISTIKGALNKKLLSKF